MADEADSVDREEPSRPTDSAPEASASSGSGDTLNPDEIEALLASSGASTQAPAPARSKPAPAPVAEEIAEQDIEALLDRAQHALASVNASEPSAEMSGVSQFKLQDFTGAAPSQEAATLDLIRDVDLDVQIELGRTHMYLEELLKLRKGSVVPLDKLAGDPVDIYVNGRLIARGEVLVLNDNFCVRVGELIAGEQIEVA
jgi:flagellar motor switch protein FliN/FliY